MKPSVPAVDNLTEMLNTIVRFTRARRAILSRNLQGVRAPGFRPLDLPVDEFAQLVKEALHEHVTRGRVVWRDRPAIRFGPKGTVLFDPQEDLEARRLLTARPAAYRRYQAQRLLENELNEKVARRLLARRLCGDVAAHSFSQALDD